MNCLQGDACENMCTYLKNIVIVWHHLSKTKYNIKQTLKPLLSLLYLLTFSSLLMTSHFQYVLLADHRYWKQNVCLNINTVESHYNVNHYTAISVITRSTHGPRFFQVKFDLT